MSTKKTIRSILKLRVAEFTDKLSRYIEKTDWEMGAETTTINPKKLEKTKIKIEFEISNELAAEIKKEVDAQTSLTAYASHIEDPLATEGD